MTLARCLLATAFLAIAVAMPAHAQRRVSFGLGSALPAADGIGHAMATLELRSARLPLLFRVEFAAFNGDFHSTQYGASVVLPFTRQALTPYLIGGVLLETDHEDGGVQQTGSGARGGLGLRYLVTGRALFVESTYHVGLGQNLLTFGVQF